MRMVRRWAVVGLLLAAKTAGAQGAPLRLSPPAADAAGGFGRAVAVTATRIAIGAPDTSVAGVDGAGVVYLFDATGVLLRTLAAPQAGEGAHFGAALTVLDDGSLVVAAPGATVGTVVGAGALSVFNPITGVVIRTIRPPLPGTNTTPVGDLHSGLPTSTGQRPTPQGFGTALAVVDGRLVVGAPETTVGGAEAAGVVYQMTTGGSLLRTIPPPTIGAGARFGAAIAPLGDDFLAGAPGATRGGVTGAGLVWLFNGTSGATRVRLQAPVAVKDASFGATVIAAVGQALVGAPGDSANGVAQAGTVYAFTAGGALVATIRPPTPIRGLDFGRALLVVDAALLVGADGASVSTLPRAGLVYRFDAATRAPLGQLQSTSPRADGRFGFALAAGDGGLVVTEPDGDRGGLAYRFAIDATAFEPGGGPGTGPGSASPSAPLAGGGGCAATTTPDAVGCRLRSLIARVRSTAPRHLEPSLVRPLRRALALGRRTTSARLRRAAARLDAFARRVQSRAGADLSPDLRDELVGAGSTLGADLLTLASD